VVAGVLQVDAALKEYDEDNDGVINFIE